MVSSAVCTPHLSAIITHSQKSLPEQNQAAKEKLANPDGVQYNSAPATTADASRQPQPILAYKAGIARAHHHGGRLCKGPAGGPLGGK